MKKNKFPKVDRRAFAVTALGDNSDEKRYWLSKTPLERLEAVELMRRIVYGYGAATARIQKVFEIVERASG